MSKPWPHWIARVLRPPARAVPIRDNPRHRAPAATGARRAPLVVLAALAALARVPAAGAQDHDAVRMRLEGDAGSYLVWADNPLSGPVQVRLRSDLPGVAGEPELPARATVPAGASVLVARVHPGRGAGLGLRMDTVPGDANARPVDVEYLFPLAGIAPRVEQAWGGGYSHADAENRHAVDFAAPPGTPVLAAREGVVMQVEPATAAGAAEGTEHGRANLVRVLHGDGTMAVYAHLQRAIPVAAGQRVRRGERLGWSGDSGFSTGPHLHFVLQANRGMRLESIPFRMFGPGGILRFAEPVAADEAR